MISNVRTAIVNKLVRIKTTLIVNDYDELSDSLELNTAEMYDYY
jgi:hypothetical protein